MQPLYTHSAAEAWIVNRKLHSPKNAQENSAPSSFLLTDYQSMIEEGLFKRYCRIVQQVNNKSALEDASQRLFYLNPENETIVFHSCTILRKGKAIDGLDLDNIRAVQREQELEKHVSTGQLTVQLYIDDLREGDTVDLSYTRYERKGDHPLRGQFYLERYCLSWTVPVLEQHIRVINNTQSNLLVQQLDSQHSIDKTLTLLPSERYDKSWQDIGNATYAQQPPIDYWPATVTASNEYSWEGASQYLHSYYKGTGLFDAPVNTDSIDHIDFSDTSEDSVIAVIRFVQDAIRYRSESEGIYSHTPKMPSQTLKKRSGDCKDKSTLLVALLAKLGVEASLVLVNTSLRESIAQLHPSPLLFNHMIVCIQWEGKTLFVDPTIKCEAGHFHAMANLPYGKALPLSAQGSALADIEIDLAQVVFEQHHEFDFRKMDNQQASVSIKRTYRGARANNMRYQFDSCDSQKMQDHYAQESADHLDLQLHPIHGVRVLSDDTVNNVLVSEESYFIQTPPAELKSKILAVQSSTYQEVMVPAQDGFPVALNLDGVIEKTVFVHYDKPPQVDGGQEQINNRCFRYDDQFGIEDNCLVFKERLTPKSVVVEAEELEACRLDAEKVRMRSVNQFHVEANTHLWTDHLAYLVPAFITVALLAINRYGIDPNWLRSAIGTTLIVLFFYYYAPNIKKRFQKEAKEQDH